MSYLSPSILKYKLYDKTDILHCIHPQWDLIHTIKHKESKLYSKKLTLSPSPMKFQPIGADPQMLDLFKVINETHLLYIKLQKRNHPLGFKLTAVSLLLLNYSTLRLNNGTLLYYYVHRYTVMCNAHSPIFLCPLTSRSDNRKVSPR